MNQEATRVPRVLEAITATDFVRDIEGRLSLRYGLPEVNLGLSQLIDIVLSSGESINEDALDKRRHFGPAMSYTFATGYIRDVASSKVHD